jgi:hypothetical protein
MRDSQFCFYHNPETEEEATEARRLGGLRRRREKTLAGAYDIGALDNVGSILRLLEIATFDVIGLDNSIARARVLISAVLAAAKLLETSDLQARIELLEAALKARPAPERPGLCQDVEDQLRRPERGFNSRHATRGRHASPRRPPAPGVGGSQAYDCRASGCPAVHQLRREG